MPPKKKGGKSTSKGDEEDNLTRIAIVNASKCKPKKCNQECKKSCPVVRLGKLCIEVGPKSKIAFISEPLCIGRFILTEFVSERLAILTTTLPSAVLKRLWDLCQEMPLRSN